MPQHRSGGYFHQSNKGAVIRGILRQLHHGLSQVLEQFLFRFLLRLGQGPVPGLA